LKPDYVGNGISNLNASGSFYIVFNDDFANRHFFLAQIFRRIPGSLSLLEIPVSSYIWVY
jgi:hypothetical protein